MYERCDDRSSYLDIYYCRYIRDKDGLILENWYVDYFGQPTERFFCEQYQGDGFDVAWYFCNVCHLRESEWDAIEAHFVTEDNEMEDNERD